MRHITHIETSKGKFLAIKTPSLPVPGWVISENELCFRTAENSNEVISYELLPEGNWQLVSDKTTRNYSEEEAAQVVDSYGIWFPKYPLHPARELKAQKSTLVSTVSLQTLLESHGLSKENEYVILKQQNK